jgi:outer membrane receptor protein involved in Fe transport
VETTSGNNADIVVTGSRIRRPNLDATVPITSVGSEQFTATGQVAVGDVLNDQPSLRSTLSQQNSSRFPDAGGLNFLDLRGLGIQRTLVLQNGRRLPPASIGGSAPDVNIIPTDLIERVDIVTGGNSAIYGSDAVAGVVNFVMKRNYEGVQLRGQAGVSERGDGSAYFIGGIAGTNFGDGRGNIALAAEFARQDSHFSRDRGLLAKQSGFGVVELDNPSDPNTVNNSDGIPDRQFFVGFTSPTASYGGQLAPNCNAGTPAARRAARCLPGTNNARLIYFQPDGTLVEGPYGDRDFRPLQNQILNGQGVNQRRPGENDLRPDLERINLNLLAHYSLSDAFEPFVELQYAHSKVRVGQGGPSFFQAGIPGGIGAAAIFRLDNPFLTNQARSVIQNYTDPGATTFLVNRSTLDVGARTSFPRRNTYRGVIGVRGQFLDDWDYEFSVNHGRYDQDLTATGHVNFQRLAFALDAARDPATGNIVCRVQIDAAARATIRSRLGLGPAGAAVATANEAADVAQCVPFNAFGENASSQAARAYVAPPVTAHAKSTQLVVNGFVTGDSSAFFNMPGGPLGFALGAEYRRETAFQRFDEFTETGTNILGPVAVFDPRSFKVKEAFGELRIPILADIPFFHELTVEAAGRVADYKGATGTVYAWNAGLSYAPVRDIRFRGNYAVAVRAPNLTELYSVRTTAFVNGFQDPCSIQNITPARVANCLAAGVPAGFNRLAFPTSAQPIISGGNPDLREETSKSLTLGAVLTPRFVSGLSLSVDYYDIKIDNVISTQGAQAIANACYDAPSLDNTFCSQLRRFPAGSVDAQGNSNAFLIDTVEQTTFNFAKFTARGIDFELAYRRAISGIGEISTRLVATHLLERNNFIFAGQPDRPDRIMSETGDPRWVANWNVGLKTGPYMFGYQLRYIGKQLIAGNPAENVFSVGGLPPQNADFADILFNPAVFYHDIRLGIDVNQRLNFYMGAQNLTDRLPPFGNIGTQEGAGIYDNMGRYFYAGAVVKF